MKGVCGELVPTATMKILLLSTYELGHQPFGLASPAAWLRQAGHTVHCVDLSIESLTVDLTTSADLVAWYLPMHTATRLAVESIAGVKALNPTAHLCCFGLYAPMNEPMLRELGVQTILGGEFEMGLVAAAHRLSDTTNGHAHAQVEPRVSLERQAFLVPDRAELPALDRYANLLLGDGTRRTVGYTEASRGCKHTCRHCPIVPVYKGRFRIVQPEIVLADIRQQVAAGASHITFGDPDFWNGPRHALHLMQGLHTEFPDLTYDVTIKIEHLLQHQHLLPVLRATGCLFVTSAVESIDDTILRFFDKRHTRADFVTVAELFRQAGLVLNPTFVTFTPWTTLEGYRELLATVAELDLVAHIAPIQYAIRLLIPSGSLLLELPEVQAIITPFDPVALAYPWRHADPAMDRFSSLVLKTVQQLQGAGHSRAEIFERLWLLTNETAHLPTSFRATAARPRPPIPHLSEPWYC
ncbi:MAG: CUAEP/CCAEP-tail radical SAM protein [Herpetosiphon sp.]